MQRRIAQWLGFAAMAIATCAIDACSSKSDDVSSLRVGDAEFEADYHEDYENDVDEDRAEAAEEAELDLYDDLDDLPTLGTAASFHVATPGAGTGRRPHGALTILMDNTYLLYGEQPKTDDPTLTPDQIKAIQDGIQKEIGRRFGEARDLGADVVRYFLRWEDTVTATDPKHPEYDHTPLSIVRPSFDASDPNQYNFDALDKFIDGTMYTAGKRLLLTFGGPIPWWASDDPQRCVDRLKVTNPPPPDTCAWKPNAKEYAMWVTAVGRHLVQQKRVPWGVTLWNEPNLSTFLADDDDVTVALRYRALWFVGRHALRSTAGLTTRVFFADMASGMTSPRHWSTLFYAMCLPNPKDSTHAVPPCPSSPRKVYTAGVAYHPYAGTPDGVVASVNELETNLDEATKAGAISPGRFIYLTEHGFRTPGLVAAQDGTNGGPPVVDSTAQQAEYLNIVDHDLSSDKRVAATANFLIRDEGDGKWDTGFMLYRVDPTTGAEVSDPMNNVHKPAYDAFKLSIDVVKADVSNVTVFGVARSCKYAPVVESFSTADGAWHGIVSLPVDELGYGEVTLSSWVGSMWRLHCGPSDYSREVTPR